MVRVARKVHDRRLLKLIGRFPIPTNSVHASQRQQFNGAAAPNKPSLTAASGRDGRYWTATFDRRHDAGWSTFSALSEHPSGWFRQRAGTPWTPLVRYADDFLVFTQTSKAAQRVARSIENYLTRKLKLVINHQKSRICKTAGVEFLGFAFEGYGGHFRVSPKNQQKFKDRVREITRRNRGVSMSERVFSIQYSVFRKHKPLLRFTENWTPKTEHRKLNTENWKPKTENRKLKTARRAW